MTKTQATARFKRAIRIAKKLYKKGKGGYKTFADAVKAAYKKMDRISGTPKKAKNKFRQTGTSDKSRDEQRSARPPGARKPRGGRKVTYYERRKNRSDAPGKLTGTAYNEMILRNLHMENTLLSQGEARLNQLKNAVRSTKTANERRELKRLIADQRKFIQSKKKSIRMLRVLIK